MRPDGERRVPPVLLTAWVPSFGSQCRLHPPSPTGRIENGGSEDIASDEGLLKGLSTRRLSGYLLPESISQAETQTEISGLVRINGAHLGIIAEMVADTRLHVETQLRQDIYLNAGSAVY